MPISCLDHLNLRAPRPLMEALKAFYCEVLGFSVGRRPAFNSFGYWLYLGDLAVLHLSEAGEGDLRSTGVRTTFDHMAFACVDRPAMEAQLLRSGIAFTSGQVPLTAQVQLFLEDPAGNRIELNFTGHDPGQGGGV